MSSPGFEDPHKKIDALIKKKEVEKKPIEVLGKSEQLQKTYDNFVFRKKYKEDPILSKKTYEVFGYQTVSLAEFIELRMWPRSIYVTDKLLRLIASSKLEFLKRYMSKKRTVSLNFLWLILIFVGIAVVIVVIVIILMPLLGVG